MVARSSCSSVGEGSGLGLLDQRAATVVQGDRVTVAPERLEGEQSGVIAALVERLDRDRSLRMREGAARVALIHREGRRHDGRVDDAPLVAPALVDGPVAVRLIGEHRAGGERQRILEVAPARRGLRGIGLSDEVVEAREVELVSGRRQGIGLVLGRDQAATVADDPGELAAYHRDVRLEGRVDVNGERLSPDEIREAVLGHRLTAGEHEQLKELLGLRPPEISCPERRRASRNRDATEQLHLELAACHVPRSPQSFPSPLSATPGCHPSSGLARTDPLPISTSICRFVQVATPSCKGRSIEAVRAPGSAVQVLARGIHVAGRLAARSLDSSAQGADPNSQVKIHG